MDERSKWVSLVGRLGLGLIFILSGFGKIAGWSSTAGYMAAKGMPIVPLFLLGAIVVELAGGLSVLTGFKAKWGALALALFLIPTTLIFHNFWSFDGMERQMQMVNFLKNVAIGGGLLTLFAWGPGPISVDARSGHGQAPTSTHTHAHAT
jgi:putative oxidoreductase